MSKQEEVLAFDNVKIASLSKRIIDNALQPQALADYILNHLEHEADAADLLALKTAIDSNFPDFRQRFENGERDDVEAELNIIEEQVKFHIGIALGRRLR